ncbi:hypothetical protein V8E53_011598 [Lactarius tabidus]
MITTSYIEDLNSLWTEVHPALLEVTRWLEPFIDCGPDYHRTTPLYDATIALRRHARELEPAMSPNNCANNLMRLLCKNRSGDLRDMQREMEFIMSRDDLRDVFDSTGSDVEVAALVDRAKRATLWRVMEPCARDAQVQDALARREIHVMRDYRPKLLRAGTAASRIRSEMLDVIVKTGPGVQAEAEGGPIDEGEVFWDGM